MSKFYYFLNKSINYYLFNGFLYLVVIILNELFFYTKSKISLSYQSIYHSNLAFDKKYIFSLNVFVISIIYYFYKF